MAADRALLPPHPTSPSPSLHSLLTFCKHKLPSLSSGEVAANPKLNKCERHTSCCRRKWKWHLGRHMDRQSDSRTGGPTLFSTPYWHTEIVFANSSSAEYQNSQSRLSLICRQRQRDCNLIMCTMRMYLSVTDTVASRVLCVKQSRAEQSWKCFQSALQ